MIGQIASFFLAIYVVFRVIVSGALVEPPDDV
jgi:hypothetical protein